MRIAVEQLSAADGTKAIQGSGKNPRIWFLIYEPAVVLFGKRR
jgi:hypothetical protein